MFARCLLFLALLLALTGCAQPAAPNAQSPAAQPTAAPKAAVTTAPAAPKATEVFKATSGSLIIYSGRAEALVKPVIDNFEKATGIQVQVRYGDTAQLAATILEEGNNSPADVFFAQDAGALGALSARGRLVKLPDAVLNKVESRFKSTKGEWVGVSGRARVVVYNSKEVQESALPDTMLGFTDPKWKGKIGWPPTNASFQAFVTALRVSLGEDGAKKWLTDIKANEPKVYANNNAVLDAVEKGEIQVGFINHYYLFQKYKGAIDQSPARNYIPRGADVGALVNVAGVSILNTTKNKEAAEKFADYLLATEAQQYFANETFEYPMIQGINTNAALMKLSDLKTPAFDLSNLADLETTLRLLRDTGVLS